MSRFEKTEQIKPHSVTNVNHAMLGENLNLAQPLGCQAEPSTVGDDRFMLGGIRTDRQPRLLFVLATELTSYASSAMDKLSHNNKLAPRIGPCREPHYLN